MKWTGHVELMERKRDTYRLFVRNPEGKRTFGRPRRRLVYNIKIDLGEIGWGSMDWIDLAQDGAQCRALVNKVMNL
jgi:hypothetical protein